MRRIAIALMGTISGLVLLFSYHTSLGPGSNASALQEDGDDGDAGVPISPADDDPSATGDPGSSPADPSSASPGASPSASPSASSSAPPKGVSGTFTGARVQTQWGPVRVRIVVRNSKIIKAQAIEYPNENHHDKEINAVAIPQLQDATVQANGAGIDAVSGATVTSQGYLASLQSALDKAHL